MTRKKSFKKVKKALLIWIKKVKNVKVMKERVHDTLYVIDEDNPKYLEFRFDSDIYDIINYDRDHRLRDLFHILMQKYNGEFETASIVRFY